MTIHWSTLILRVVGFVGIGFVYATATLDAWLGSQHRATIAERIQPWTKRNPWFAALITLGLGALINHFFFPCWFDLGPCT